MKRLGRLAGAVMVAAALGACGSVRQDGLGGGGQAPGVTDGGAPVDGGAVMTPPGPRADGGGAPAATGLQLRAAGFTDGFQELGWQCNGALCLKGRIAP